MTNVFSKTQERMLQKPKATLDLNYLASGRKMDEIDISPLKCTYKYRLSFFRGKNVEYNEGNPITKANIIRTTSTFNPEGIEIILPFIIGSPGWTLFQDYPLMRLAQIKNQIADLQVKLATRAVGALEAGNLSQLKNIIYEVVDMFTSIRNKIETIQPQQTMGFQQPQMPIGRE